MHINPATKRPRPHSSHRISTTQNKASKSSNSSSSSSSTSTIKAKRTSCSELARENKYKDSVCIMCSDTVKTRRHHHFSSTSVKRMLFSQHQTTYMCPMCQTPEPTSFPPTETRRIVLCDSSLYGVWSKPTRSNIVHFDIDSIVGGKVQDLTTALIKNYLHMPNRVEIIVVAGINNIGAGDTAEQVARYMAVMKQIVRDHSTKWRHETPSYVSFCTVVLAPKYCSLQLPPNPGRPEVALWVPPPNFRNRYPEIKKLNEMIIAMNKEGGRDLKMVRMDHHGTKRLSSGAFQHKFDNVAGAAPIWREEDIFKKLHFTMDYRLKIVNYLSNCFRGNSGEPAQPAAHD